MVGAPAAGGLLLISGVSNSILPPGASGVTFMGKSHRNEGFTLLELLMVVVVMAFAISVTYPSLSRGTVAVHLRTTGRQVLNTLRYAREKAITEQKVMKVWVDRATQKITLTDEYGEGARSYPMPHDVKIQRVALMDQEIMEGPLVIRFLPNGSGENGEILLRSDTGGLLRVMTDPITGGARIFSPSGGPGL